jgi:malonyl CoA-acyl carrier protein transacylase/3-hydroxymyristoyl/3-hydroxydecanoyl-(acyl carrier protein) dehydratase
MRLSKSLYEASSNFDASAAFRMAVIATSWAEFTKRSTLALKAMEDEEKWGFLQAQGILLTRDAPLHAKAKVAHMYPGQGSQYVGMTHDLYQRYSAVQDVWAQADETMTEVLDGESLSSFVLRSNLSKEEQAEAEHKLKQTEYTQPAMLTADLAIERALNDHGLHPDMVAGHSLGEYAALMAAGILDMDGALRAAAARGTEMGAVEIEDKGLMASVSAPYSEVETIINSIEGYVIAANKNSPKMTVIAGETAPVKEAMAAFDAKGFQSMPLATSHAFHSRIVAPANEPLRRFLESLEIRWPTIPITANVDGEFYPMNSSEVDDLDASKEAVLSKLALQMASSVEWTTQIQTMYQAGARAFIEVGPKRALSMFAVQILEDQPHLPVMTNHPKQGGIASFLAALATMALAGRPIHWPEPTSSVLTEAFRAGPVEAHQTSLPNEDLRTRARPLPSTTDAAPTQSMQSAPSVALDPEMAAQRAKDAYLGDRIAALCGYPARFCNGMVDLRLGLGMSDADIGSLFQTVASEATTDPETDVSGAQTVADVARWVAKAPSSWSPRSSMSRPSTHSAQGQTTASVHDPMSRRKADPFVVTGVSLGLPGGERVFNDDTFERLVRGETCISEITDEYKQRLLDKNLVRLIKGRDGSVNMDHATEFGDIPQLAGVKGAFDLAEEFGIDPKVILAWDITTQLGMAAGLLALRDAAIPLTPVEQIGKGGLRLIRNWQVPQHTRDRTGIVFASCFPGFQMALKHAKNNGDDGEGRFDRRYLFQTLAMGHSQFAQYSGIRGPNTIINLACASATAAFGVAEDWLNADRVDRVVIISADDVTGDDLWEWIGGGFAASGAAATHNVVEETALPFDRRRNGLILGMGAAAFVVERNSEAEERGVQPIAELLGATTANSAFHGTRLDVDHVAETVDNFVTQMEQRWGLDRHEIASDTVFFSHETYTPARGGSAQSEVRALRDTFTHSTDQLVIANTKGFTGHPMAVGIEDASMFHGMKTGRIPPIANHKETDPELGNLNLSKGGDYPNLKYGLRFAAGFGSQMALSLVRRWPVTGERIDGAKFLAWNRKLAGTDDVVMRLLDQKLVAYVDGENNLHGGVQGEPWPVTAPYEGKPSVVAAVPAPVPTPTPAPVASPSPTHLASPSPAPASSAKHAEGDLVKTVIDVVVKHTGYPADFVELDQDLEGELGIDTVKQAEIMADIREHFSLPVDEEFILSDYPTLNHMIGYIQKMTGGEAVSSDAQPSAVPIAATDVSPPAPTVKVEPAAQAAPTAPLAAPVAVSNDALNTTVVEVVVKHTGYPADFIELDQDLEGELGIDTVKQAEIMADIREQFSLPLDEDFVLSDYPTLNHMIGYIQRMQGGKSTAPPTPTPAKAIIVQPSAPMPAPTPTPPAAALSSNSDVDGQLVEIVVKHTGYPADFIEMDQDLEGELGIDTVKQAEIMGDVREAFSLPLDEDFVLSDHPTLNHFTAYILKMTGADVAPLTPQTDSSSTEGAAQPASDSPEHTPTRRWQIEVEAAEGIAAPLSLGGTTVVTDDGWGIAEAFCQRVEADGMKAIRVGFESNIRDMSVQQEGDRTVYRADPGNPEHVAAVCEALSQHNITALIHMSPLKLASAAWSEDGTPSTQIALAAQGYFALLKGLDAHFASLEAGVVASVTALDGRHGNIGERFNSVQCAASGVTKSYAFEQPHIRCRALDLHPELILNPIEAAHMIHADVFQLEGDVEVGLDRDGRRWALVAFAEDLVEDTTPLTAEDTWLVSGGGSGVTAASIIGVAKASDKAGAHFALLGRSRLIEQTSGWVHWTAEQLETERMALRERMTAASDSGKVTMVQWNTAWQKFTRSRDVYITLNSIKSTGNSSSYHPVDVMDLEGMKAVGAALGRPITGLIHGAGLEDSKLVGQKDSNVFDRVVRVKVDGWQCMLAASSASGSEQPRFAACFTSVAGRFGNGGQTDYAAANSVLDAEMARLTASGSCRAVAIGWTGWRDVGMATRGSIEAVFAAAGIDTLSVQQGVQIFVNEALCGGKRRVIGCGSLGAMDRFDVFREAPLRLPAEMAGLIADPERFPFVDKVLSFEEGQSLATQATLSTADHPFLIDHAIEGVPYHPGVMALEMFAEVALLLRPSTCLAGFESVEFGLPVKLLKGAMTVRVHAEHHRTEGEITWVSCKLVSDLANSKGEVFGEREHHKAMVRLVEKCDDLCPFLQHEVEALPDLGVPAPGELLEEPSFIYRRYFHGPRFQSHGGVLRGVGDASMPGADGIALMRHQLPQSDQFVHEASGEVVLLEALPMLIEAGFQNAGLVAMESEGFSSLPVGIEWSSMLRVPERDEQLRMRSIRVAVEDAGVTVHDVVVVGEDNAPVLALKGLRLKGMAPVAEEDAFTFER